MEDIVPMARFIFRLQTLLRTGQSLTRSIPQALGQRNDEFTLEMSRWWVHFQSGADQRHLGSTDYRALLIQILEQGLGGVSIMGSLDVLYVEVFREQEQQMKRFLEKLPFRLLFPLLLCFFPAFLILLFGPIVQQILQEVTS